MSAQIRVPSTKRMSTPARKLFFKPNCIEVKIRLKIIFRMNGNKIMNEIFFVKYR